MVLILTSFNLCVSRFVHFSICVFLNLCFSQFMQFSITVFLSLCDSQSVRFSISVFLNLCDSQLVFFSICAILNLCDSQLVFFSIKAVWGRHRQLDDSLVGQLTTERPVFKDPCVQVLLLLSNVFNESLQLAERIYTAH